jgi:lipopolysaccharide biosynthesis glycosyltransferase
MIGNHSINRQVQDHFGSRIHQFIEFTVEDAKRDLQRQGLHPIWTWDDWHASIKQQTNTTTTTTTTTTSSWANENTIPTDSWDNRSVHAHELNHLRFYLPHLSIFRDRDHLFFIDDDILVQTDLAQTAHETLASLDDSKGFVTPCGIWKWRDECQRFHFSLNETMLNSTAIYGNRQVCKSRDQTKCVPESYQNFLKSVLPPQHHPTRNALAENELEWNFGFSLFALRNWRNLGLTDRYETVMKENYRLHVYPETSLAFGLGVPFLAFVGAVECWNDDRFKVRDGFGFIDYHRMQDEFGEDFLKKIDVIHYTGANKPWEAFSTIQQESLQPWLEVLKAENLPIPPQLPSDPAPEIFTVIGSDQADTEGIMSVLDRHPQICASGEYGKPEVGFPNDVMDPAGQPWAPDCSVKKGCTFGFVRGSVMELVKDLEVGTVPPRCQPDYDVTHDQFRVHLKRLCNFVAKLNGDFSEGNLAQAWVDAFYHEDKKFLGCGCKSGTLVKGLRVKPQWIAEKGEFEDAYTLDLTRTRLIGTKVIRIKRRNIWCRVKSRIIAETTQIWNPQTVQEQNEQLKILQGDFVIDLNDLKRRLESFKKLEELGDRWASKYASEVLWIEQEECSENANQCMDRIYAFLGVDKSKSNTFLTDFLFPVQFDSSLDHISNKQDVHKALEEWGATVSSVAK